MFSRLVLGAQCFINPGSSFHKFFHTFYNSLYFPWIFISLIFKYFVEGRISALWGYLI